MILVFIGEKEEKKNNRIQMYMQFWLQKLQSVPRNDEGFIHT